MLSKTLDEWLSECRNYSAFYYERYVSSLNDFNCPEETSTYYCMVAYSYWTLRDLLAHIKTYGSVEDKEKCSHCKRGDEGHTKPLQKTYVKYKKLIDMINKKPN